MQTIRHFNEISTRIQKAILTIVFLAIFIMAIPYQSVAGQLEIVESSVVISPDSISDWRWNSTQVVSTESTADSFEVKIASDSKDNLHVVWQDLTDYNGAGINYDIFYKKYNSQTSSWGLTVVISSESTNGAGSPDIAIDNEDNLHVVWIDSTDYNGAGIDGDIVYKKYNDQTSSWGSIIVISTESTGGTATPTVAIDSANNLHVVWIDNTDYNGAGIDNDIFYKQYNSQTSSWGSLVVLSTESTSNSVSPNIAIDSKDNLHVIWVDATDYNGAGGDYDIFYKKHDSQTNSWGSTVVISTESTGFADFPDLAIDSANNLHVTWFDATDYNGAGVDDDIFYKQYDSQASTWGGTFDLSANIGISFSPVISVDGSGVIHLVWHDYTDYNGAGSDADIFYRQFGGTPDAPILVLNTPNPSNREVRLNWNNVYGAKYFNIYRDTTYIYDLIGLLPLASTTNTHFKDLLISEDTYYYVVTTGNVIGEGLPSNTISVMIEFDTTETVTSAVTMVVTAIGNETTKTETVTTTVETAGVNSTSESSEGGFLPFFQIGLILPIIMIIGFIKKKSNSQR